MARLGRVNHPGFPHRLTHEGNRRAQREAARTGRPRGGEAFVRKIEERMGRALAPQKRGRKPSGPETLNIMEFF